MRRALLLGGLAVALAVWVGGGFGAPTLPAPTITAAPANPSSSRSATFTYTDSQAITRFECALDGSSFAPCGTKRPSSSTYNGLPDGSHTFQVRAVSGSATSAATTYAWSVDTIAPRVASINRVGATPTSAATVQWTVAFTESVTGVASNGANFSLVATALSGSPGIVPPVTGVAAAYTVTATTGTGTTGASGTLQLRLTSGGAIRDAAGNALAGGTFNGQTYVVDKTPPPAPTITSGPPTASASTLATLAFADSEVGVAFLCGLDGAVPAACASPKTLSGLAQGAHTFRVQARDAAGNTSAAASRSWTTDTVPPGKPVLTQTPTDGGSVQTATFAWTDSDPTPGSGIAADSCVLDGGPPQRCSSPATYTNLAFGSHSFSVSATDAAGNSSQPTTFAWTIQGLPFSIAGSAAGLLYPGAPFTPIALTISNPNSVPIFVTSLTVTVATEPSGCAGAANLEIQQSPAAPGNELAVPAGVTDWPVPAVFQPKLRLRDTGGDQDACQGRTFVFAYSGSAHS